MRPASGGRVEFYRVLCSPSYCSAPQTWQTDSHRLMRDRHRRHILNRLRHHRADDASAVKTRIKTFWSIASGLFPARSNTESFSGMNDEQCQSAGPTFCLALVSKRVGSHILHSALIACTGIPPFRLGTSLGRAGDSPWFRYTFSDHDFAYEPEPPARESNFDPRHR
jgi:hypothetical protein